MILVGFSCRFFRSFSHFTWSPPPGLAVLAGPNGAGKSNLLEALAVFGNLSSFRPGPPASWVQHGQQGFYLKGELRGPLGFFVLEQEARLGHTLQRALRRSGRRLVPAEYLTLFPVATFSSHDRELILGPPQTRRRFLDRLAFHLQPQHLDVHWRFRRALRQRNAALSGGHREALDAFEGELARWALQLVESRLFALRQLTTALEAELERLGWLLPKPLLRYHAPEGLAASTGGEQDLRHTLRRSRPLELARGHTLVGPHRHDVAVTLSGRPARELLSAGQVKLLATALRLAAVVVTTSRRKVAPLVVFDDVDAELDGGVLTPLLQRLAALAPQVVVSTAHPEVVLPRFPEATVLPMQEGRPVGEAWQRSWW
ncbi:MAG: DNA replication and repair protein RecF [Thermoanaerobaculum sp.]|nr:DNA replication and repair protein RecF [Thermoanaerobaculum sp.]MDW7966900.1 DNA replication and repair protein RecF [Thermoanaerobaculum sp.]